MPHTRWLKQQKFSHSSGDWKSKLIVHFWWSLCSWLANGHLLARPPSVHTLLASLPLIRSRILPDQGTTLMTSFNLNYLPKGPKDPSPNRATLRVKASTNQLWGRVDTIQCMSATLLFISLESKDAMFSIYGVDMGPTLNLIKIKDLRVKESSWWRLLNTIIITSIVIIMFTPKTLRTCSELIW